MAQKAMATELATESESLTKATKNVQFCDDLGTHSDALQRTSTLDMLASYAHTLPEPLYDDGLDTGTPSIATMDIHSPWAKKNILSFDGGGVRGYSSLLILKRIMEEVGKRERQINPDAMSSSHSPRVDKLPHATKERMDYRPCHYFDYIAGTSTGGLTAIMLGRLRMSVDATMDEYKQLSARVFEKPSSRLRRSLANYSSASRRKTLTNIFHSLRPAQPSPEEKNEMFLSDSFRCRTMVCSMKRSQKKESQMPFLFRSYVHIKNSHTPLERNPGDTHDFNIADVARATSGAPSYRRKTKLPEGAYYDAAVNININNPSWEVINEIRFIGQPQDRVDILLSVGGGNGKGNRLKSGARDLHKGLMDISDDIHYQVQVESKRQNFLYYRLDVEKGLQDVRLNEWKPKSNGEITLRRIESATNSYLKDPKIEADIKNCARALVESRIERAKTQAWETFATGTRYRCTLPKCDQQHLRFQNRNELMDHLQKYHSMPPPDEEHYEEIQGLLDAGRTNSD